MDHIKALTRYVAHFVDELVKGGLTNVVISPGSRSTPLAMTMCEHKDIKEWVLVDERSAAFFALGMAKETSKPVALLCTSGTAAANYYPAIIEAHYGRVPLVVLTTDRPHELRDVGAPQAIEQIKMYGDYVKWFHEVALPEDTPQMLSYIRNKAMRAVQVAGEGNPGPVHLNFPFREPLVPDFSIDGLWQETAERAEQTNFNGTKKLSAEELFNLSHQIVDLQDGVIVCGPQMDAELAQSVVKLASTLNIPILADPLSQIRAGKHDKAQIIEGYDAILRTQSIRERLKPAYIIRFGAMPVSKSYLFYENEHQEVPKFIIENNEGFRDPTSVASTFIYAGSKSFCDSLVECIDHVKTSTEWLAKWQQFNQIVKRNLSESSTSSIAEGEAVQILLEMMPTESTLYVGNSMAVRDVDTFFMTTDDSIFVLANRGTNGIDGVVSSALGAAATSTKRVTLIIGDLSFYHDLNGLLAAKQYVLNITILLVNNNGGGIFSFLPQAQEEKHFETLFGTPLNIEFQPMIEAYGGKYSIARSKEELKEKFAESYQSSGLSVIEVKTNRQENLKWRQQKWQTIEQELLGNV